MSIENITQQNLAQFTGTTVYYRYMPSFLLTEGIKYLMDNGAGWLIDIIASVRALPSIKAEEKEFWTLNVDLEAHTAEVICTDGDKGDGPIELYRQKIDFTDFPMKQIKLYVIQDGNKKVCMVPSEY